MFNPYLVQQDGADFYLYEGSALEAVITYPSGVRDFDLEAARKARTWFENLAKKWGLVTVFESSI